MENNSPELKNIWNQGKNLSDAVWYFTDYSIRREYTDIELKPNAANATPPKDWLETLSRLGQELSVIQSNSEKKKAASYQLWNNLYKKIIRGKLIAVGFKYPINSDFPTLIPEHMWPPENIEIGGGKSTISANEIKYVRVHIIKCDKKEIKLPKFQKTALKTGRPVLVGDKIIEAYNRLDADGQINVNLPLTRHYEAIRKTVRLYNKEFTDDTGMSDETIRLLIAPLFNAKKASQKVSQKQ